MSAAIFLLLSSIAAALFLLLRRNLKKPTAIPTNFPIVGMLPALLLNSHRVHDFITDILSEVGGTFEFKGPTFSNLDMVLTSDPSNVHHVFSRSFLKYPKGPDFRKMFGVLGDGIFNTDFAVWEVHRKATLGFVGDREFNGLVEGVVWGKVEKGVFPVLDSFVESGGFVDLQDVFQRMSFDGICRLVLGFDPESLAVGLPEIQCEKAFNDAFQAVFYRHLLPETVWRLQRRLGIGREAKLAAAEKALDEFIYPKVVGGADEKHKPGLLKLFADVYKQNAAAVPGFPADRNKFLRDTSLSLMFAGRDTTSACLTWLFFLIARNPSAEEKILEEIEEKLRVRRGEAWRRFTAEESRRLVYLQGALSESLRLFPPVALEHKAPAEDDTLPTGTRVKKDGRIIFSFYTMGRMESIWGKDWPEFRPERWISDKIGGVVHVPSFHFPAFNAGPRTCLGKDMAFIQMKMAAAAILFRYRVELVGNFETSPRDAVILQSRHGLKVTLSKRHK
ncbi:hypothetical protein M569_09411 [Genlisea aurea]|uniref:Cytochrome P450 n=1 Tax=Genlisea aurea TaxID=192259 RepID=S8CKZ8_9LAMI|nr:hypothetical protein M569_09411 [Genlisea aurea]